ncbi:helix-turn-helix domain-containing protein, partial [Actinophytocola sediminis]
RSFGFIHSILTEAGTEFRRRGGDMRSGESLGHR